MSNAHDISRAELVERFQHAPRAVDGFDAYVIIVKRTPRARTVNTGLVYGPDMDTARATTLRTHREHEPQTVLLGIWRLADVLWEPCEDKREQRRIAVAGRMAS